MIVIDRTGVEPIAGIVATLVVAVCGWLLLAGPARRRQVRRLVVATRQVRDLDSDEEMSDRDGTMTP